MISSTFHCPENVLRNLSHSSSLLLIPGPVNAVLILFSVRNSADLKLQVIASCQALDNCDGVGITWH